MFYFLSLNGAQQIAHHAGIDAAVLGLGGLPQPSGDENVSNVRALQRSLDVFRNLKIERNMLHALRQVVLVTGNTGDRPTLGRDQMIGQVAADNA